MKKAGPPPRLLPGSLSQVHWAPKPGVTVEPYNTSKGERGVRSMLGTLKMNGFASRLCRDSELLIAGGTSEVASPIPGVLTFG